MDENILKLLDKLAAASSTSEVDRSGFLLGMLVERNSGQKSPEAFYREVLPEPYFGIALSEPTYREVVAKVAALLRRRGSGVHAQQALVSVLASTDDRTLDLTIPALVDFLSEEVSEETIEQTMNTLRTMLGSAVAVKKQAPTILECIQGITRLDHLIRQFSESPFRQNVEVLQELKRLLRPPY